MRKLIKGLFIILFIVAHIFILRNIFLLSKDMLTGDLSAEQLLPMPRFGFERIPASQSAEATHAQNRLAIDFAQIYFPSRQFASLGENYRTGALDPLQRSSRYAPLLHFLCSITLCRLDYGIASLLHMAIQTLLFYFVLIYSFITLKLEKELLPGLFLVNSLLFLTPIGLSWFERGQFSLYVGTSYLLMILGFIKKKNALILVSALFAFIKWTSFPYISVVLVAAFLNSKSLLEAKRTLLLAGAFLLIIITLTFTFPAQSMDFLKGLYQQERFSVPGGISLAKVLPVWIVKFLPIPVIFVGWLHARMNRKDFLRSMPFLAGSAVLMLTYPTLAYEYNLPSLLGFIPLFIFWTKLPDDLIPPVARKVLNYSLLAFGCLASFSNAIGRGAIVLGEYILISAILLIVPVYFYWKQNMKAQRSRVETDH